MRALALHALPHSVAGMAGLRSMYANNENLF
jgi:hypothetical protein